jgi:hypothetical protein
MVFSCAGLYHPPSAQILGAYPIVGKVDPGRKSANYCGEKSNVNGSGPLQVST